MFRFKAEAEAEARKALALLRNKIGWKIEVKENTGWYATLRNSYIQLNISKNYGDKYPYYWCLVDLDKSANGGEMYWTEEKTDRFYDPNVAVIAAVDMVNEHLRRVMNCHRAVNTIAPMRLKVTGRSGEIGIVREIDDSGRKCCACGGVFGYEDIMISPKERRLCHDPLTESERRLEVRADTLRQNAGSLKKATKPTPRCVRRAAAKT